MPLGMSRLPPEIPRGIFSRLGPEPWELAKCATINKAAWHAVSEKLYNSVRLRQTGSTDKQEDEWSAIAILRFQFSETEQIGRQKLLLESLASNESFAALVREFRNDAKENDWTTERSADPKMLLKVARNMSRLHTAALSFNLVAMRLITLPSWTATLQDLTISCLGIEDFIWPPETQTVIRRISWTAPRPGENEYYDTKQSIGPDLLPKIIKVFSLTCPDLEELDLKVLPAAYRFPGDPYNHEWNLERLDIEQGNFQKYDFDSPVNQLKRLKHFGLETWMYMEDERGLEIYRADSDIDEASTTAPPTSEAYLTGFFSDHSEQLMSLAWDVSNYPRNDIFIERELPKLKNLKNFRVLGLKETKEHEELLRRLLSMLSSLYGNWIKELKIGGTETHDFAHDGGPQASQQYGQLIGNSFSNLKILKVSTWMGESSDGFIDFDEYTLKLLKWARQLPSTHSQLEVVAYSGGSIEVIYDDLPAFCDDVAKIFMQRNMKNLRRFNVIVDYEGRGGSRDREELVFRRVNTKSSNMGIQRDTSNHTKLLYAWWVGSAYQHGGHKTVKGANSYKLSVISGDEPGFSGEDDVFWTMDADELMVLHYECDECEKTVFKNIDSFSAAKELDDNDGDSDNI